MSEQMFVFLFPLHIDNDFKEERSNICVCIISIKHYYVSKSKPSSMIIQIEESHATQAYQQ